MSPKARPAGVSAISPGFPCVATRKVPASAQARAASCAAPGLCLRRADMKSAIMTTFRLCSTVAVAEFECSIAAR